MIKIETNSKNIFRYDDVLDKTYCDMLCDFIKKIKGERETSSSNKMPWQENDSLDFKTIEDHALKTIVTNYRQKVKNLVMLNFKRIAFINFTDIVLWRTGKQQERHKDNGYDFNSQLRFRKFTSITYLNEDFEGGSTFIQTEYGHDYISQPKTGSVVLFFSDERTAHGVQKINKGVRITLPIWFCTDYFESEEYTYNI